ncbi:MAG TPA: site-specific integrase [Acidobacteriaceae bacterium]
MLKTKPRGLFERPPGSGIWWINYYVDGKQHREKVGSKSAAISLYQKRKADDREGKKLPDLRSKRFVTVAELVDDLLEHVVNHKDLRNYQGKAKVVKLALGGCKAEDLRPKEIAAFLNGHCNTPATYNRYKAFLSLAYRLGEENDKVSGNPARKAPHRREPSGRIRFLSREDEYPRLLAAIRKLSPEHIAEFVVSVMTGMRLTEQYTTEWSQYHQDRRVIELTKTKNGDARTVHLNEAAIDAIESLRIPGQKMKGRIFPRTGGDKWITTRDWFLPALKEAEVDGYHWHGNRHTFCSWLAMAGASTVEIMKAAGHKSMAMAARYSHLSPKHALSVVDRIAGAPSEHQHAPEHAPAK